MKDTFRALAGRDFRLYFIGQCVSLVGTWVQQVAILFAGTQGLLDDVEVRDLRAFEDGYYPYLESSQSQLMSDIESKKALDDDIKARLKAAIEEYKKDFLAKKKDAAKETVKA